MNDDSDALTLAGSQRNDADTAHLDKLSAVLTLGDLERVLNGAGKPRSIAFNALMREQFDADRAVREEFPNRSATAVMERFVRAHPTTAAMVERLNLVTCPALVLAVARVMATKETQA